MKELLMWAFDDVPFIPDARFSRTEEVGAE